MSFLNCNVPKLPIPLPRQVPTKSVRKPRNVGSCGSRRTAYQSSRRTLSTSRNDVDAIYDDMCSEDKENWKKRLEAIDLLTEELYLETDEEDLD